MPLNNKTNKQTNKKINNPIKKIKVKVVLF